MPSKELISINELEHIISSALFASNTSHSNSIIVSKALVQAEIDGKLGHGISRVESYCLQAKSGKVNGNAVPKIKTLKPGVLAVDAKFGFAYPALEVVIKNLPTITDKQGIALAGVYNSNHFGVAGQFVEKAANAGKISIIFGNTPSAIAPWNGKTALFGTNPIAFGAPLASGEHLVIDMAVSKVARGKILKANQLGEKIPYGWALDKDGNPTDDPKEAMKGTMLPFGESKGSALALMIELLAAAITGANFAFEADSFFSAEGSPPAVGQMMIMIDPGSIHNEESVLRRISTVLMKMSNQENVYVPGSKRFSLRKKALENGLFVDKNTLDVIKNLI